MQPLNTHAALSAAVSLLNLPSSHLAVIQLSDKNNLRNACIDDSSLFHGSAQVLRLCPENNPITQLFSLALLHISSVTKRAHSSLVCIGYSMKQSRVQALTAQGMLPFLPIDGTFFLPVDLDAFKQPCQQDENEGNMTIITLAEQVVDVFLHKATDFFEDKNTNEIKQGKDDAETTTDASMTSSDSVPQYQPELHFILNKLQSSGCCIIDPLENLEIVIDRVQMAHALDAACKAARKLALPVRTPAWHLIQHKFSPEILRTASTISKVSLPCVLKPQIACGVDESHQMAFVLHPSGLHSDVDVPLPAVLQEYVDHNSTLWKVYVAGNQVFSVQKRSTPNLQPLRDFLASYTTSGVGGVGLVGGQEKEDVDIPTSIEFNSLESLPISLPWLRQITDSSSAGASQQVPAAIMHPDFLTQLAQVLRKHLGLTLFGFDVVFDYAAGETVVLDLNFFPSFRGIPEAPRALRTTLLEKYETLRDKK
jgi:hypothetical protein